SDCMILSLCGMTFMVDTADVDDYEKISAKLDSLSVTVIDCLVITHFDKDHIGSAAQLIQNYEVKRIIAPSYKKDSSEYVEFVSAAYRESIEIEKITETCVIESAENRKIVIYPPTRDYGDDNNNSLITAVYAGDCAMLLMGDAEKERTFDFLDEWCSEKFDIVKLPHHGDYFKELKTFFDIARPEYCIVTVGERASAEEKLLALASNYGSRLLYSCDGEIYVKMLCTTDGKTTEFKVYQ
ncbi:MAG: ComEC/Rec2 family competence protein, partial [Eubacteriales bacterium]